MNIHCFVSDCYSKNEADPCERDNGTWFNQTCFNQSYIAQFDEPRQACNASGCTTYVYNVFKESLQNETANVVASADEYFK